MESSDIDLFVDAPQKPTDLSRFDRLLKRRVNLTFGKLDRLNKDFLNSVLNGVILYGGVEV